MDWKQYSASLFASVVSLIGSLAWPVVVFTVLIIVRKQLVSLASRLTEVSLPGGAKAVFQKELESGRDKAEEIALEAPTEEAAPIPFGVDPAFLEMANNFPEAAVLEAFKDIERVIFENRDLIPDLSERSSLAGTMRRLTEIKAIDRNVYELFRSLQQARNEAAHGKADRRITPGEALEYREQASVLVALLRRVFANMRNQGAPALSSKLGGT